MLIIDNDEEDEDEEGELMMFEQQETKNHNNKMNYWKNQPIPSNRMESRFFKRKSDLIDEVETPQQQQQQQNRRFSIGSNNSSNNGDGSIASSTSSLSSTSLLSSSISSSSISGGSICNSFAPPILFNNTFWDEFLPSSTEITSQHHNKPFNNNHTKLVFPYTPPHQQHYFVPTDIL
ncbi:hypothetical protein BDC45DRAFT_520033 [Circinella umbellata]|nr:hypothetical protein BDC45DRAFT_520033 [Circinella umbellata]